MPRVVIAGVPMRMPDGSSGLRVDILEVNRDAWPILQAENQFNDEPEIGMQMILITMRVSNLGIAGREQVRIGESQFSLTGSLREVYKPFQLKVSCGVTPNEIGGRIGTDESLTGNLCMQVPTYDSHLTLIYDPPVSGLSTIYIPLPE